MTLFWRDRLQINEQIAAADQVHLGEGRIVDQVVLGENAHVADAFADAIATFGLGEKAAQALRRDVALNIFGIGAGAGLDDRDSLTSVPKSWMLVSRPFHRGIRARRSPPNRFPLRRRNRESRRGWASSGRFFTEREKQWLERIERSGIAEKTGDVDQHVLI